jgi:hypothetical protein
MQNFAPWGFSAEQFWQRIDLPVDQATGPPCITRRREGAAAAKGRSHYAPSPHRAVGTVLGGGVRDAEEVRGRRQACAGLLRRS